MEGPLASTKHTLGLQEGNALFLWGLLPHLEEGIALFMLGQSPSMHVWALPTHRKAAPLGSLQVFNTEGPHL